MRYTQSNLIMLVGYVTKCSGQQLGGPWGYSERADLPEGAHKCSRCFKEERR
jgi:hypothetical protein